MWSSRRMLRPCLLQASRPRSSWCARAWRRFTSTRRSHRFMCASGRRRRRPGSRLAVRRPPGEARTSGEGEANMGLAKMHVVASNTAPDVVPEDDMSKAGARPEALRLLEAMLFAASEPLSEKELAERLPEGADVRGALTLL